MAKKLAIISRVNFQKRDYSRYGIEILKKKFKVDVLDLSEILIPRSKKYFKKFHSKNVFIVRNIFQFIKILKKNKYDFVIEYLENSPKEIILRIIIKLYAHYLIKYLGGIKSNIIYSDSKSIFLITMFKNIITNIKLFILILLNKSLIDLVLVPGKDFFYQKSIVKSAKKILFTNSYDYNEYLLKKSKKIIKKKYFTYIDQNFISHPDFYIKRRKPFVSKSFYNDLEYFFCVVEKKYNVKVLVCLHPKTNLNNCAHINKKRVSRKKTFETIKNSSHVFAHYSTAISYAVLLKKPISFLTSNEFKKIRQGYQTKIMAEKLNSKLININKKNDMILNFKIDKFRNNEFIKNYLCHPKSKKINTWIYLSNYLN
jgi:hypothetical protein